MIRDRLVQNIDLCLNIYRFVIKDYLKSPPPPTPPTKNKNKTKNAIKCHSWPDGLWLHLVLLATNAHAQMPESRDSSVVRVPDSVVID